MNRSIDEQLAEIYQNYIDLGADLLMLEAVLYGASRRASEESAATCLERLADYIEQHSEAICQLTPFCVKGCALPEARRAEAVRSSRAAAARVRQPVWSRKGSRSRGRAALPLRVCPKTPR